MSNCEEEKLSYKEWSERFFAQQDKAYFDRMDFVRDCQTVYPDIYAAMGTLIATAAEGGETRLAALKEFDDAVAKLRDVYRKHDYDWGNYVLSAFNEFCGCPFCAVDGRDYRRNEFASSS